MIRCQVGAGAYEPVDSTHPAALDPHLTALRSTDIGRVVALSSENSVTDSARNRTKDSEQALASGGAGFAQR